jgi:hypothetical protein
VSASRRRACAALIGGAGLATLLLLPLAAAQGVTPPPTPENTQEPTPAQAQPQDKPIPSFAELEAAGAKIGAIRIANQDIFDLDDPKENNALFRLANKLHIQTRPGVIERSLLLKTGEPLSVRLIDETERLLRANRYLYDVSIRPIAYQDGVADIEVLTRDTWSLDAGFSVGRAGGANSSRFSVREYNLLGTGVYVSFGRTNTVDRSGNEFQIQHNHAFDGWTALRYSQADNNDGKRREASVQRPFYALDSRWAAGASASKDDRVDAVYAAGVIASQYRHRLNLAEAFGGWSEGLISGWTQRYSLGLTARSDAYRLEPGRVAPMQLPSDQKIVAPFFRYEVVEDDFEKLRNRNQMGRPEFFALGFASTLQLGRALKSFGSSEDLWLYSGSVSNGFSPAPEHELLASASLSGQYGGNGVQRQLLSAAARYYLPLNKRILLYGAVSGDRLTKPDPSDLLTLGGDNGLRGYPLRYQTGEQRALITLEARAFTDPYLFRLFRIGGAAFLDAGRAWGGVSPNPVNAGWLTNVGFGLRIFSVRSAFGNVLHADVAFPLNRDPSIKSVQFLLKTKTSF